MREHPIAGQGGRPDAARAADGPAVRAGASTSTYSSKLLTNPEANIRIGTAYLADKLSEFGDLHLVLASYNAGERPVHRWMSERPEPAAGRVHRRHPVSRDAELRAEDSRHGRGLSPPLRRGGGRLSADDEIRGVGAAAGDADLSDVTPAAPLGPKTGARRRRQEERAPAKKRKRAAQAPHRRLAHDTMSKLTGSQEGTAVHRVGHPRDDAAQRRARRRQSVAGISRFRRRPPRSRTPPAPRSTPTSISTRSPGARGRCARRSRASSRAATASRCRRRAGDGLLRVDRGDDVDDDGHHRSGRRSGRLRAVLRELRSGRDSFRRDAALRDAARAPDWTFDPDELAAAFNEKTKAIILNTPNNPTGKVFTREELETIAALCRKWDAIAISDEIYEHIIYDGQRAHSDRDDSGHGGSDGDDQRAVENLQRDRLAGGLDDLAAVADRRDSQGPRFPDRRRAGAAAGGRRGGAGACRTSTTRPGGGAISGAATCCSTSSSGITSRATRRSARTTS